MHSAHVERHARSFPKAETDCNHFHHKGRGRRRAGDYVRQAQQRLVCLTHTRAPAVAAGPAGSCVSKAATGQEPWRLVGGVCGMGGLSTKPGNAGSFASQAPPKPCAQQGHARVQGASAHGAAQSPRRTDNLCALATEQCYQSCGCNATCKVMHSRGEQARLSAARALQGGPSKARGALTLGCEVGCGQDQKRMR